MSKCPKCGADIPVYSLSQNCKQCGVNLRFFNFEENFIRDAKESELARAGMNIFIAKLRASTVGSGLTIARMVLIFLPVLSVLAPVSTMFFRLPLATEGVSLNATGLYSAFSGGYPAYISGMLSSEISGRFFVLALAAILCFALNFLICFIAGLITLMNCFGFEKSVRRNIIWESTGLAFLIASIVLSAVIHFTAPAASVVTCSLSPLSAVCVVSYIPVIAVNVLIGRKGYNLVSKEGDAERAEIYAKVKSGEINIDDLPFPVVETDETRAVEEKIAAQRAEKLRRRGGEISE